MKLFMVIYMASKIGGTVGPLEAGMEECMRQALYLNQQAHTALQTGMSVTGKVLTDTEKERIASMRFACEYHVTRPKNDYP